MKYLGYENDALKFELQHGGKNVLLDVSIR